MQESVFINVPDDHLGHLHFLFIQIAHVRLFQEMGGQRTAGRQGIENKIAPLLILRTGRGAHGGGLRGIKVIAPLLTQLGQTLHLGLKIIKRLRTRFIGGIHLGITGGFGGFILIRRADEFPGALKIRRFLILNRHFLQHRILLQLLVHHALQIQHWRLQKCQRLLHLRGHHLDLRQFLSEMHSGFKSHGWAADSIYR